MAVAVAVATATATEEEEEEEEEEVVVVVVVVAPPCRSSPAPWEPCTTCRLARSRASAQPALA